MREESSYLQRRKNVIDIRFACLVGLASFVVYLVTMARGAFPGASVGLLLSATGIEPRPTPMNPLWTLTLRMIVGGRPEGMVWRIHLAHVIFGALTLSLLYRCVSWLVFRAIDWDTRTFSRSVKAAVIAGLVSAVAAGSAIPFWIASTRCYPHVFGIMLLLFAALMVMRYEDTGRLWRLIVFALIYGVGLAESAIFWMMAPPMLVLSLWSMLSRARLGPKTILPVTMAGFVGCMMFFVAALMFYDSEGFHLSAYGGFLQIIRIMLQDHLSSIRGALPRVGWLIVLLMIVVPWLAAILVAARALNDERDWSFYILHIVLLGLTVMILWGVDVSPWELFGLSAMPVMQYVLNGMVTGYLAAYVWLLAADWWPSAQAGRFKHAVSRWAGAVLLAPLLVFLLAVTWRNLPQASGRQTDFLSHYADLLLDMMDGREWLISDGSIDQIVMCRAHEREIDINLLNLAMRRNRIYIRRMQGWFDSQRLKNTAELGVLPLIQDWIQTDPEIERKAAIFSVPDLWAMVNEFSIIPNQALFLATRAPDDVDAIDLYRRHQMFWNQAIPLLVEKGAGELPMTTSYRNHLRRHTAFVANNLGVWLEDQSLPEEAFDAYLKARQIDENNISSMLNLLVMLEHGHRPDKADLIRHEAESLLQGISVRPNIWTLSRHYGYVREPMFFARLGQTWALSGQPGMAVSGLSRAIDLMPEESRGEARQTLADIYLLRDEDEHGEALYWEMLAEQPDNEKALLTLARIATRRGDFERARELLDQAEQTGATTSLLAMEWASFYLASGQPVRARLTLEELVDLDPANVRAWAMLAEVLVQQNETNRLEGVIREMERLSGPDDYLVLVSRAQFEFLQRNWRQARKYFRRAVRQRPGIALVREWTLRMDFLLGDKHSGEQSARDLLRIDRDNAFANYIMGSLLLERGRLEAAEDHLRHSLASRPSPEALNDLAVLLQQIGEYEEAESMARAAYQMNERMYAAWDTLGVILMRRGKLEEAEKAFEQALSIMQDDMRVYLHMAQLQMALGNTGRARELVNMLESRRAELPPMEQGELRDLALEIYQAGQ